ncbi:MAG: anti-sigma factor family protein [Stellaceae bacterium]
MTKPKIEITDDDLHAYVDGTLDAADRLEVALYLVSAPAQAARVEAFRAQKEAVGILFAGIVDEPLPRKLTRALRLRSSELAARRYLRVVVAAALAGLLLVAGGMLATYLALRHPAGVQAPQSAQDPPIPAALPARRNGLDL